MILSKFIKEKKVAVRFMVHSLFEGGRGMEYFKAEMAAVGVDADELVEGTHYTLNTSDACFPPHRLPARL